VHIFKEDDDNNNDVDD